MIVALLGSMLGALYVFALTTLVRAIIVPAAVASGYIIGTVVVWLMPETSAVYQQMVGLTIPQIAAGFSFVASFVSPSVIKVA